MTVIGWTAEAQTQAHFRHVPLADLRRRSARETARQVLDAIPDGAPILLHFDIDARIRIIEMTEYAALRDADQKAARQLVDLLVRGLGSD